MNSGPSFWSWFGGEDNSQSSRSRSEPEAIRLGVEWLEDREMLSTTQTFDGGGTPFLIDDNGNLPAPALIADGSTGFGVRLAYATNNPPNVGVLSFPRTDVGAFDQVLADFDFRITPGESAGAAGRADGLGITFLSTDPFIGGVNATNVDGGSEEPNFPKSFSVGFDTYQNDDLGDIGNDVIRPNYSNSISLHFDGVLLPNGQFDASPILDLASGGWNHARIVVRPGQGFSDVSVILTPPGGIPTTLVDRFRVAGLTPYENRVYFGARSGGESSHHDLDNIAVAYSNFGDLRSGMLEFSAASVAVDERGPMASLTVNRLRGSSGAVTVQYETTAVSATAGADFTISQGILTFPAGDNSPKTIQIPIRDDAALESAEQFQVRLFNATGGAVLGVAAGAVVTIVDDEGVLQDFDAPGAGTVYVSGQHADPPTTAAILMDGGPTGEGKFIRLAHEITDGRANNNSIAIDSTRNTATLVTVADFDFRITPRMGRADGMGFALLDIQNYGTTGVVAPVGPLFAPEEPDFVASVGIGLDIFNNNCDGCPPHPDDDINQMNIHNIASLHFNGQLVRQFDATSVVDLANGQWLHARFTIEKLPDRQFAVVSLAVNPCDGGQAVTLIDRFEVPDLLPYAGRPWFGARSGGLSANHDLDNVNVKYLDVVQSAISLGSNHYTADEGGSPVTISVHRSGNTAGTTTVQFTTQDLSALSGVDYLFTQRSLVFGPGETIQTIPIPILDDATVEADQSFMISLTETSAGAVLGGPFAGTVTIFDDETSAQQGRWGSVICTSAAAIHATLLPNGNVIYWDRLGAIHIMDPITLAISNPEQPADNEFCGGQALLANGELLVTGGHEHHGAPEGDGIGLDTSAIFDYMTNTWDTNLPVMNAGRWYPTNTTLGTGEVLVLSGSIEVVDEKYIQNPLPQIWQPVGRMWRDLAVAGEEQENSTPGNHPLGVDLYPRMFLAPDGRVYKAGPDKKTWFLDVTGDGHWTVGPQTISGNRTTGSAVYYDVGKILIVGGGNPPTATAEKIDLTQANPVWNSAGTMAFARRQVNAVVLPDGKVMVFGGTSGAGFNNEANPVLIPELWDPETNLWTPLPAMQVPRLYHGVAMLMPDGRIFSAGGGQGANATSFYNNGEFFSPPYMFSDNRPTITNAPNSVAYGEQFLVETPDAQQITRVSLIRLPSVTHSFDFNGRYVSLGRPQAGPNGVTLVAPDNRNIAPPGHYLLFILDGSGIPSVAKIIQIIDPLTRPDDAVIAEDAAVPSPIDLLANDTNLLGAPLAIEIVSGPIHGTIMQEADGRYSYRPQANFSGNDSFTYRVSNGTIHSNSSSVSIRVTPENDAPVAMPESLNVSEDGFANTLLQATDADTNDSVTFGVVSGPSHGELEINPITGQASYRPSPGYSGPDSFTFQADDGSMLSNLATVNITVTPLTSGFTFVNGLLTVIGTTGADSIRLNRVGQGFSLVTNFGNFRIPIRSQLTGIVVQARDGNDNIGLSLLAATQPAVVDGGAGDDLITTGAGHDILLGALGNDNLKGGRGDDLLIGGAGIDRLYGLQGNDILLSGIFDDPFGQLDLRQSLTVWSAGTTSASRRAAVQPLLDRILDDRAGDILSGASGIDFLGIHSLDRIRGLTSSDLRPV